MSAYHANRNRNRLCAGLPCCNGCCTDHQDTTSCSALLGCGPSIALGRLSCCRQSQSMISAMFVLGSPRQSHFCGRTIGSILPNFLHPRSLCATVEAPCCPFCPCGHVCFASDEENMDTLPATETFCLGTIRGLSRQDQEYIGGVREKIRKSPKIRRGLMGCIWGPYAPEWVSIGASRKRLMERMCLAVPGRIWVLLV